MKSHKTRRLAAIMFTDIVGYTTLMQNNEKAAASVRARHRREFNHCHNLHQGEIIQYFGDGTLSVFHSGVEAVECAIAIQRALNNEEPVPLRIGLHMGDIVFDGTEIYGDGVNLASRIESMGISGAILISGKLNDELKNHKHISTVSLGHYDLKNIAHPVEVFSISNEGIKIPARVDIKGKHKEHTQSIAVLPFVNMSSSKENEYLSDGMTEEIINALSKIKNLKVTSRTSSFFFKNKKIPIPQIGQELNVSTILEGSLRLSSNKIRITAQLIDVANDFHFWSETFDRSMEDIFAVQDEISLLIADKLREHTGHFELDDHLVDAPKIPIELYKKYLQGRYYLMKLNLPGTEKGISILQEVIEAQPDFPLAYLDINQGYAFLGTMGLISAREAFSKAKPFLDRALQLDENLPKSQLNLAWISCWQNWDLDGTYRHLIKALEVRATDDIYLTMSNTLAVEGKFEAALTYVDKALELDPFAPMNHHFKGFIFFLQEKFELAIPCFKKSLELQPELYFPKLYWGLTLLLMGRKYEGLTLFRNLTAGESDGLTKLGGTSIAYASMKDLGNAEEGIRGLEAALQTEAMGSALYFLIIVKAVLGSIDNSLELIERGIRLKLPMMLLLKTDPFLIPMHSIPRFQDLMRQIFGDQASVDINKKKYKKNLFNDVQLEGYRQELNKIMSEQQPYLDPNLTLRGLAQLLNIPPNSLSQLLNEGFDKNFSEFVNTYRLEAFKTKASDPDLAHLTILALAFDSGFNSKTVFNTFFKKMMGITPRAFWKDAVR